MEQPQFNESHLLEMPSAGYDTSHLVLSFVYGIIFFLGIAGNLRVMRRLVLKYRKSRQASNGSDGTGKSHLFIYIWSLSVVDSMVLMSLPFVVSKLLLRRWVFGRVLCHLYWLFETVNKTVSTFLLVTLSANCYLGVCHPQFYKKWKRPKATLAVVFGCVLAASFLLAPVIYYTDVVVDRIDLNDSNVAVQCVTAMPHEIVGAVTMSIMSISFIGTGLMQICCYALLLHFLHHRRQNSKISTIPFWKVVKTVVVMVSFYFIMWSPYWVLTVCLLSESAIELLSTHRFFGHVILVVHSLPYITSTINPTLYSRLLTTYSDQRKKSIQLRSDRHRKLNQLQKITDRSSPLQSFPEASVFSFAPSVGPVGETTPLGFRK